MRFPLLFVGLLAAISSLAQVKITPQKPRQYDRFADPADSIQLEKIMTQLNQFRTSNSNRKLSDSLFLAYELLRRKSIGFGYIYSTSHDFTSWEEVEQKGSYQTATMVSISSGSLRKIPKRIMECQNLQALELVNTRISKIPRKLQKLAQLKTIAVYNSKSKFKIGSNKTLATIIVRGGKNPKSFKSIQNLEKLDLSNCNLATVPETIHRNKRLKELLLNGNAINLSQSKIQLNASLAKLEMQGCSLTEIPASISNFLNLKSAAFNGNKISKVDPAIAQLHQLEQLSFYNNKLTTIPEGIYGLAKLREIDLYYNEIERVDDRIAQIKNLEVLYLSNNKLINLPASIGELSNLTELYVSNNRLSSLPESIARLSKLKVIRANNNNLIEPPNYLLKLNNIENIDYSSNSISTWPLEILDKPKLQILVLAENPWDEATKKSLAERIVTLREKGISVHIQSK